MKKFDFVAGIDISKKKVDVAVYLGATGSICQEFTALNNKAGIKLLLSKLKQIKAGLGEVLFCMEQTGIYSHSFASLLLKHTENIWIVMAYQLKNSLGLHRGKSDRFDARQIATYGWRYMDMARTFQPGEKDLLKLKELVDARAKLNRYLKGLLVPINEMKEMELDESARRLERSCSVAIKGLERSIALVDKQIEELIESSQLIKEQVELITSIPAIGQATAIVIIAYTQGFIPFADSKKLACYCGVAPFPNESGTSLKRKSSVHFMANKRLKRTLHMAALRNIRMNNQLSQYYKRKVSEGKSKMSAINALRNKILSRMYAIVNSKIPYQENYLSAGLEIQ